MTGEEFGINSFKVFMAYKDVMMLDDHDIIECFKVGSKGSKGSKGSRGSRGSSAS